jgi:hypothetical protein
MLEGRFRKAVQLGQRIAAEDSVRFRGSYSIGSRSSGPSTIVSQTRVTARLWT